MSRENLKMNAKDAMRDAIVSPYMVTVIMGIIIIVLSVVQYFFDVWGELVKNTGGYHSGQAEAYMAGSIIFFIISFVLSTIVQFGYRSYCLKAANRDNTMSYGDLFASVRYLLKALGLSVMIALLTSLWTLLFIVPGIIAVYRYSQAIFVLVENPDKGVMQCIRESKEMMDGHKWELFVLELSFILWQLLSLLTCLLAYIYVLPYMTVTFANFYNSIKPKSVVYEETAAYE